MNAVGAHPVNMNRLTFLSCMLVAISFMSACRTEAPDEESGTAEKAGDEYQLPIDVVSRFQPTQWGDAGRITVQVDYQGESSPGDEDQRCIRVHYEPGEKAWGGVYWQKPREFGVRSEAAIPDAKRITLWARGEQGGEMVSFQLPGDPATELLKASPMTQLSKQWRKLEFELKDREMSGVLGLFGAKWRCLADENPEGITFYIDQVRIEG